MLMDNEFFIVIPIIDSYFKYSTVKVKLSNARRKFGLLMDAGTSLSDSNKLLRIFNEFQCFPFVLLLDATISFNF